MQVLHAQADDGAEESETDETAPADTDEHEAEEPEGDSEEDSTSLFKVLLSVLTTVVCWGSYGPLLHRGQVKMENCRLRPFMCVGLAYFAIAVIVPLLPLESRWSIRWQAGC